MVHDLRWLALRDCHVHRVEHDLGVQDDGHRPADYAAAPDVEDPCEVKEARPGRHVRDARDRELVPTARRERSPHKIGGRLRSRIADGRELRFTRAQAMVVHYLVGTDWTLEAYEPAVTDLRRDGNRADVDLQMRPQVGPSVDIQVKASGTHGVHDRQADAQILAGVTNAFEQLPDPPLGPALIVVVAQRAWPLCGDTYVLEKMIGSTSGCEDRRVLLHDDARGAFASATHVSGIVILDHRRGLEASDYGCAVLQNPWADYPLDPAWFPHARVLMCGDGVFTWLGGAPSATTFPTGTRFASEARDERS